jgi:TonB family protein
MRRILAVAALSVVLTGCGLAAQDRIYKPGGGVQAPVVIKDVKPNYTGPAMRREVEGIVELTAIVLRNGTVGDVTIKRSVDKDLDQEAIKAAKQWEFKPGTKAGEPVNVQVDIEMAFTLRK